MKYSVLIFLIIVFASNVLGQKLSKTYYAYAVSGLKLREAATQSSAELGEITFGDAVSILEIDENVPDIIIDGLRGKYVLIKYNNIQGYTFSGYLSRIVPPSLNKYWVSIKDYAESKYKKVGSGKSIEIPVPFDPESTKKGTLQKYEGNVELYDFGEECSDDEQLKIKDISFQEAFLLITTFNWQYRNIRLDTPSEKNEDNKCYCANLEPKKGQYALYISREKGANGEFNAISICFDAEAGSGCVSAKVNKDNKNEVIIEFSYSCS